MQTRQIRLKEIYTFRPVMASTFTILKYDETKSSARYKAVMNDGQMVVAHLQTVDTKDTPDVSQLSLCLGVNEADILSSDATEKLLIEKVGEEIVFRSRNCQLLFNNNNQGLVCQICEDLFSDLNVEIDREELKQEDFDNVSEAGSDTSDAIEAESDEGEKVEPTVIRILKRKMSETEKDQGNIKKKRSPTQQRDRRIKKKKEIPMCSAETNSDSESDQLYHEGDINQDPDWNPSDQTGIEGEGERTEKIREEISCPFCEEKFYKNSKMFSTHLKYSHPKEKDTKAYKQAMADNILPGFVCSICGKKFENDRWLDEHTAEFHNFHINNFPCEVCGKYFKNQATLKTHVQNTHEKNKQFLCGVCGKLCLNKPALNDHTRYYHSNEEFPCMECGLVFKSKSVMRRHFNRKHSIEEKQYKCQTCEKAFRLPAALRKHISQVHDKLKPFYCENCHLRTSSLGNLNIHRKKSHQSPYISRIKLIEMVENGQHPFYTPSDIPMIRSGPH